MLAAFFMLVSLATAQEKTSDSILNELMVKREALKKEMVEIQKRKVRWAINKSQSVEEKDVLNSPTYYGAIARGSILIHIKTNKAYYLTKNLKVMAHRKIDHDECRWLVSNNGKTVYKVSYLNVPDIEEVTAMVVPPHFYKPLKKKKDVYTLDKHLDFESSFRLHIGAGSSNYTKDLISENTSSYSEFTRMEIDTLAKWEFPTYVGLNLVYERFRMNGNTAEARGNFWSYGILIKSPEFKMSESRTRVYANYRYGFRSSLRVIEGENEEIYKFNLNTMNLGIEWLSKNFLGEMTYGFNYQRQWLKPIQNAEPLNVDARIQYDDSIALVIGQAWEFAWY